MAECAAAGDWEAVTWLEPRRAALIRSGMSRLQQLPASAAELQALVSRLAELDAALVSQGRQECERRGERVRQKHHARQGTAAYRDLAGR